VVHRALFHQEAFWRHRLVGGFNEMIVALGYQWAGHPGQDGDEFLTLHDESKHAR